MIDPTNKDDMVLPLRNLVANKTNLLKVDPTRLGVLRRSFGAEIRRRFLKLRRVLNSLLVEEDALNLKQSSSGKFARWTGLSIPDRARAFESWLTQVVEGVLYATPWWEKFSADAYERGVARSYDEVRGRGVGDRFSREFLAAKAEFVRGSLRRGITTLASLSLRLERELRGMTNKMSQDISRLTLTALELEETPTRLATQIRITMESALSRVLTIADTELTRSHAEAQLDALGALGVEEVSAVTGLDSQEGRKVCPVCRKLEGGTLPLDEAYGVIPQHPNCWCAWRPI